MILYHGSNIEINEIDLSISKVGKDFGCGFYLSPDRGQAQRIAEKKVNITKKGTPCITTYKIDDSIINGDTLRVIRFDRYSKEWAEFISMNRQNRTRQQAHDYDIVIGPIADDDIGLQMRRLTDGYIDIQQFLDNLKYKTVTIQYFFGTNEAITQLQKI